MISAEKHRLQELLRRNGHSLTKNRMLLFDIFYNNPPLSVAELHDLVASAMDRASLYRTVALFEELGVVHRVTLGWKYKLELSEAFSHHHHHLTCLGCGKVVVLPDDPVLERRLESLGQGHGFDQVSHQLELQGYCHGCGQTE